MDKSLSEILESGLIESYLMGLCSESERAEFEYYLDAFPEVRKAYSEYELSIEKMAIENAELPPESIKQALLSKIQSTENHTNTNLRSSNSVFKWIAGALALLLVGGVFWMYSSITKFKTLQQEHQALIEDCENQRNRTLEPMAQLELIKHHETQTVVLNGSSFNNDAEVIVFWNPNYEYGLLDIESLPKIDDKSCYQIWADKDGKMISRGVFDYTNQFIKIDYLEDAESLNITIEPKGGKDHPTVERLVANGLIT